MVAAAFATAASGAVALAGGWWAGQEHQFRLPEHPEAAESIGQTQEPDDNSESVLRRDGITQTINAEGDAFVAGHDLNVKFNRDARS